MYSNKSSDLSSDALLLLSIICLFSLHSTVLLPSHRLVQQFPNFFGHNLVPVLVLVLVGYKFNTPMWGKTNRDDVSVCVLRWLT